MRPVSGLRVPAVGGNADNGGNAGLEYLNVNNGVSTANANYGSPLNFLARLMDEGRRMSKKADKTDMTPKRHRRETERTHF